MTFTCKYNNPFINEVFEDNDPRTVADVMTIMTALQVICHTKLTAWTPAKKLSFTAIS